jgi:hypothetical protein
MPNTRCPMSVATECAETSREPPNQIQTLVRRAQQQAACV